VSAEFCNQLGDGTEEYRADPAPADDVEVRLCRTCLRPITHETRVEDGRFQREGWYDDADVDPIVCFKSADYRHRPLSDREHAYYEAGAKAERERIRDLTSRLGFGDGITEPQADNDTIVAWFEERDAEAREWRESQRWRDDCHVAGHPEDEDCWEHDPLLRADRDARASERERIAEAIEAVIAHHTARVSEHYEFAGEAYITAHAIAGDIEHTLTNIARTEPTDD
jgi:hypothetical protein